MSAESSQHSSRRRGRQLLVLAVLAIAFLIAMSAQLIRLDGRSSKPTGHQPPATAHSYQQSGRLLSEVSAAPTGSGMAAKISAHTDAAVPARVTAFAGRFASAKSGTANASGDIDLLHMFTPLRGLVHKEGILDINAWHVNKSQHRLDALMDWRRVKRQLFLKEDQRKAARGAAADPVLPPHERFPPPPIFPGCHLFVNHRYRYLYLRHAKAASTSLHKFFGECINGATSHNSSCFEPIIMNPLPQEQIEAMWKDYLVFTFVRNPWARAVSTYKMMMRHLEWQSVPLGKVVEEAVGTDTAATAAAVASGIGKKGADTSGGSSWADQRRRQWHRFALPAARTYGWDNFCSDPSSFELLCRKDRKCSSLGRTFAQVHVQAQTPCLLTAAGGWAVDFIGSVEQIDEDLRRLLDLLDARRGEGVPPLPRPKALPNVNKVAACMEKEGPYSPLAIPPEGYCHSYQYYSGRHKACVDRISEYYQVDVDRLFPQGAVRGGNDSSGASAFGGSML